MGGIYGRLWTNAHGLSDQGGIWRKGLVGIPPARLAAGLRKLIEQDAQRSAETGKDPFPPTVGKFRGLCLIQSEEVGAPMFEDAYRNAIYNAGITGSAYRRWSHDAVHQAAIDLGFHVLRNSDNGNQLREQFRSSYQRVIERLANGEVLQTTLDREAREAQRRLAAPRPQNNAERLRNGNKALDALKRSFRGCAPESSSEAE